MSYCPNCGTQNPDSSKFCNNCGTAIPKVEPVVEKKTTSSAHSPEVGSKVSLTAQDGKTYTGTIQEVKDDQFNIKYDGFDFEAWLTQAHFTVLAVAPAATVTATAATTTQSHQQTQTHVQAQATSSIAVGTKVSLVAADGKAYTGTIQQANGEQYKIKYDGFDFEAWLTKENFTVLSSGSSAATATVQSQPQTHPVSHQHTSSIAIGTKVNLIAQDGKKYTGTIQEANGNQYKIKYDGYNFEAWLTPENFSVISGGSTTAPATVQSQPQQASSIAVGTRVSLVAQDGKAYTGTIQQANGEQYKIKYDGFNFEAWLTKEHFTVLPAGSSSSTATVQSQPASSTGVGSRVSLTAQDGKSYTGVVQEVNGNQYKIKYDGFNFEAWLTKEHFTML